MDQYPAIDILVRDDGSNDKTIVSSKGLADYPNINFLKGRNLGVRGASWPYLVKDRSPFMFLTKTMWYR